MSRGIDRAREEPIKAKIVLRRPERYVADAEVEAIQLGRRRREPDMAEASRDGRLLRSHTEPEPSLPDVPLHKRGFGVMDEDTP